MRSENDMCSFERKDSLQINIFLKFQALFRIYSNKKQEPTVDFMTEHINITMHHCPIKSQQKLRFYDGVYYTSHHIVIESWQKYRFHDGAYIISCIASLIEASKTPIS